MQSHSGTISASQLSIRLCESVAQDLVQLVADIDHPSRRHWTVWIHALALDLIIRKDVFLAGIAPSH